MTRYIGCSVLHNNTVCLWKRMELIDFLMFELFLETFLECLLSVSDVTMITLIITVIMVTNTYGVLTTCQAPS